MSDKTKSEGMAPPVALVKLDEIQASKTNPRRTFDEGKLKELAGNIKTHGVLSPVLVRALEKNGAGPRFELVAGERRWRAARMAGLDKIPALLRELTDAEALEVQYIENLQREDLTALEEAEGYRALIESGNYTAETLAAKLGKSRSHVFSRLRLTKMILPVREAVQKGQLAQSIAELIGRIPVALFQEQALQEILAGKKEHYDPNQWDAAENRGEEEERERRRKGETEREAEPFSFREAQNLIAARYLLNLANAPWDLKREGMGGKPSCEKCPKRSGNCKEEWPEIKSPNVCTDRECYALKERVNVQPELVKWAGKGHQVFGPGEVPEQFGQIKAPKGYAREEDGKSWNKGGYQSLKEVIGKAKIDVKPTIAVDTEGKAHKLYPLKETYAALEEKGWKLDQGRGRTEEKKPSKEELAAAEAQAKQELAQAKAFVERSVAALLEKFPEPGGKNFWWYLTVLLIRRLPPELVKGNRNAWLEPGGKKSKQLGALESKPEACRLALLSETLREQTYERGQYLPALSELAGWLAGELGVDLKKVGKETMAHLAQSGHGGEDDEEHEHIAALTKPKARKVKKGKKTKAK